MEFYVREDSNKANRLSPLTSCLSVCKPYKYKATCAKQLTQLRLMNPLFIYRKDINMCLSVFVYFLLSLMLLLPLHANASCHPTPDPQQAQYLIGYGSLIQTQSKQKTDSSSGPNRPVRVYGYHRGWFAKGTEVGYSTTYLAVSPQAGDHFNGTLFQLNQADSINNYDAREKYYCRVAVDPNSIHPLTQEKPPKAQFWIYVIKPNLIAPPSEKFPLVQSYVDIFLSGCLEIENKFKLKGFAAECVKTTSNWSVYWINDRLYPRRPFVCEPKAGQIDELLKRQIPRLFKQIALNN